MQIYGCLIIVNGLMTGVELSFTLYYLHHGSIRNESVCGGWIILNYTLIQLTIFLLSWTSIERYLLIHHEPFFRQHKFALHYIPIGFFHLYTPLLYIGLVLVYPCQPAYDITLYLCGGHCYSLDKIPGFYDWFGNGMTMQFIIMSVNAILIIRHAVQRSRMKKMIVTVDRRRQWVSLNSFINSSV